MRAALWVPGKFSLTNKMISNIYAASKYRGKRPKDWRDYYAEEVAAIRLAVKSAALRVGGGRLVGLPGQVCTVKFGVLGHRKHDPDAWCLLGKAALDGMVDARVFSSDRHEIWETAGRVFQTDAEERELRCRLASFSDEVIDSRGVAVFLDWKFDPCERVASRA